MKRFLIAIILFALAAAGGFYYYTVSFMPSKGNGAPLKTAKVERGELRLSVAATGVVIPDVEVEVKSKAAGEILSFPYNEGDEIKKGEVVVRLDPEIEESRVRQAEADLLMAEGRLEKARVSKRDAALKLKRRERLFSEGIISEQELDDARIAFDKSVSDVKIAEAELIRAREQLKEASDRLRDTEIRAPLSGTILKKLVEEGQVISSTISSVSEGTLLFTMANLEKIYVSAMVDEVDIMGVRPGLEALVTVDSWPGREFRGRVVRIAPKGRVERTVTVFDVLVEIIDPDRTALRPGMSANVEIVTEVKKGVLLVPNEALKVKDGVTGINVLRGDEPVWVRIKTGDTNGLVTEVENGVGEGSVVVLSGRVRGTGDGGGGFRGHWWIFKKK